METKNRSITVEPMLLSKLLEGIVDVNMSDDREIYGVSIDSRCVSHGELFIAIAGMSVNGFDFIEDAVVAGASAIIFDECSVDIDEVKRLERKLNMIPVLGIEKLSDKIGHIASRFYRDPTDNIFVTGITGTNGKTSCSHFLAQALEYSGIKCGVAGTLGYGLLDELKESNFTTPNAISLQSFFLDCRNNGIRHAVMEVSSHALDQGRVDGVAFDAAIFTNLSHDHLDYHKNIEAYGKAKRKLFDTAGLRYAIINQDDDFGRTLIDELSPNITAVRYGLTNGDNKIKEAKGSVMQVVGKIIKSTNTGFELAVDTYCGEGILRSSQLGRFNASNLLAVLSTLLLIGMPFDRAVDAMESISSVPGRMEHIGGIHGQPLVVIDYAHTPDALESVLITLSEHCLGNLWCVFGCGGNRDRMKRPRMGAIAEKYADYVVITNDNPRYEDPVVISKEILQGMKMPDAAYVCHDREQAIVSTIRNASADDIILIAGKGHERYQYIKGKRERFSDKEQVCHYLKEVA